MLLRGWGGGGGRISSERISGGERRKRPRGEGEGVGSRSVVGENFGTSSKLVRVFRRCRFRIDPFEFEIQQVGRHDSQPIPRGSSCDHRSSVRSPTTNLSPPRQLSLEINRSTSRSAREIRREARKRRRGQGNGKILTTAPIDRLAPVVAYWGLKKREKKKKKKRENKRYRFNVYLLVLRKKSVLLLFSHISIACLDFSKIKC